MSSYMIHSILSCLEISSANISPKTSVLVSGRLLGQDQNLAAFFVRILLLLILFPPKCLELGVTAYVVQSPNGFHLAPKQQHGQAY